MTGVMVKTLLYSSDIEHCLLPFSLFCVSTVSLYFFLICRSLWWKLNEASPSATVFTYTRLCLQLKAFLCCSTLWALSCLVFPLVTLLALTDFQVKWTLRAACVYVCDLFHPSIICHQGSRPLPTMVLYSVYAIILACILLTSILTLLLSTDIEL